MGLDISCDRFHNVGLQIADLVLLSSWEDQHGRLQRSAVFETCELSLIQGAHCAAEAAYATALGERLRARQVTYPTLKAATSLALSWLVAADTDSRSPAGIFYCCAKRPLDRSDHR